MPAGRPTKYTEKIGIEICGRIAMGNSLTKVCSDPNMPSTVTVYTWFKRQPELLNDYTRAKFDSGDADQDKLDEVAEKVLTGEIDPQAARVAADIIKWSASKKQPKKYGDYRQVEHSGAVKLSDMTDDQLKAKLADIQNAE